MIKLVNLTPHAVNVIGENGETIMTIQPSGMVVRCSVTRVQVGKINGIPVNRTQFGAVEGLPESQPDTVYIVSALVAQAVAGARDDVVIPDDAVRDEQGRVIGCRAFARV